MARFYGEIGFYVPQETAPGVWTDPDILKRNYYGEVMKNSIRTEKGESINDNIVLGNRFSILADAFAVENFQYMRYVKWQGVKWKVTSVEVERPRLIVSIGDVWSE